MHCYKNGNFLEISKLHLKRPDTNTHSNHVLTQNTNIDIYSRSVSVTKLIPIIANQTNADKYLSLRILEISYFVEFQTQIAQIKTVQIGGM